MSNEPIQLTKERAQLAIDEIRAVCKKHGIALVGTHGVAGMYGEITVIPTAGYLGEWQGVEDRLVNSLSEQSFMGDLSVLGIGDIAGQ
jgi:hypothetical protein